VSAASVLRVVAASYALLLIVILLGRWRERRARLSAAFLLTVACYLLLPVLMQRPPTHLARLLFVGSVSAPFAFWLLAREFFDDEFRLRRWQASLLLGLWVTHSIPWSVRVEGLLPALREMTPELVLVAGPRLLSALFALDALYRICAGARADLVESRLRSRYAVLGVAGVYVLLILGGETLLRGSAARVADVANAGGLFLVLFGASVALLRFDSDFLKQERPAAAPALAPQLIEKLVALIEGERIYRKSGLTIGALAARLREPEYRVRQVIHSHLGFRNFNALLNHYRVRDAREALRDAGKSHLGIAEIAFELGYQSLGPFNKAFKELTGQTPTEFRKNQG
jgi:AraC-like DNA-binding protein